MSRLKLMSSQNAVEAIANKQMRQANRMTEILYAESEVGDG